MAAAKEVALEKPENGKRKKEGKKSGNESKTKKPGGNGAEMAVNGDAVASAGLKLAQTSDIDAGLNALFASSSGPIAAPIRPESAVERKVVPTNKSEESEESEDEDDELGESSDQDSEGGVSSPKRHSRKRTRDEADIEDVYMEKLAREERLNNLARAEKQRKHGASSDSDSDDGMPDAADLVHESLLPDVEDDDKLERTVFLSNVSVSAIKSKASKKTLLDHLFSFIPEMPSLEQSRKIESIRFRSTAYGAQKHPKRAGFALKEVLEATTKSTNAYVVYSTADCVPAAIKQLNGSIVLDRHLRVDSAAHPARVDNKRCVFVGNLDFVNDEQDVDEDGKKKKRAPSDVEEGLWQTFSKAGKVENVRVVRDEKTRVGKGIAYVQFENANAVEAALLFNDQKFPPLLPRKIRVARAKATTKTAKAREQINSNAQRPRQMGQLNGTRKPRPNEKSKARFLSRDKPLVFEGQRASRDAIPSLKRERKKGKGKPTNRSARRGAAWKAENKK